MGELPKSITERALSDVFLNGMVTMIRTGVPERDAMIATLGALSDALREMTKRAVRVAETAPPSAVIHVTPPGHVLVGPEARDAIANAVLALWNADTPHTLNSTPSEFTIQWAERHADAVLRALGVRGGA